MAPRRILFLLLASFVAAPAAGAELYRCVAAGGAVSFQDAPCAGDSRLSRTIPIQVDAGRVEADKASGSRTQANTGKPTKARGTASKAGAAKPGSTASDTRGKQRSACTKARKDRDAALDRLGLNRTFEKLQALDQVVQEACKGL